MEEAIRDGDIDRVLALLHDTPFTSQNGQTLFHLAVRHQQVHVLRAITRCLGERKINITDNVRYTDRCLIELESALNHRLSMLWS